MTPLFHIYMNDHSTREPHLHNSIILSTSTKINTLHFADDQVIIADSEDNLQRGVLTLQNIKKFWNGNITRKH
jgi:hypothetical protein